MRVVMVMYDSLNRRMLPRYGCESVHAPNFTRLARRATAFDTSYVCSMPCMPARRDWMTGRPNFLHRPWGPLDPYDRCVTDALRDAGVYSHLCTDHQHYFEDGGSNYHCRYDTWEFFRGQEGDPWKGQLDEVPTDGLTGRNAICDLVRHSQDRKNRAFITDDAQMPQAQTFTAGIDFVRRNAHRDKWFIQIETFDPHEPFFTQPKWQELYPDTDRSDARPLCDWPEYGQSEVNDAHANQLRGHYASLVSFCDKQLGDVLDLFDELNLWDDTMLIVWTDHGFLLGEHKLWAKNQMPLYDEIANTPFFVWDPRCPEAAGRRRSSLVQPAIDLPVTLLGAMGAEVPASMLGKDLQQVIADDTPVREAGIFGYFGLQVNVTDGRYVYMRAPASNDNQPLHEYTLSTPRMRSRMPVEQLAGATLAPPFEFMQGCPPLKLSAQAGLDHGFKPALSDTLLFDRKNDPGQAKPIDDPAVEQRMIGYLKELMQQADAPAEQYQRLGLA